MNLLGCRVDEWKYLEMWWQAWGLMWAAVGWHNLTGGSKAALEALDQIGFFDDL